MKERQADRLAQNFTQTENERDSISFNQDVAPEHLNSYQQNFNKDRANLIEINNSLDTHSESGKTNDVSEFKKCHTMYGANYLLVIIEQQIQDIKQANF